MSGKWYRKPRVWVLWLLGYAKYCQCCECWYPGHYQSDDRKFCVLCNMPEDLVEAIERDRVLLEASE